MGEKIVFGITQTNDLVLISKDLKVMTVPFGNGALINDVEVCLANNKIPVALVTASFANRQHQVISVNLLNM